MKLSLPKLKKKVDSEHETRAYRGMAKARFLNILTIFAVIFIFGTTLWFVYTNIYQTIGKVQTLLLIKADPTFEPIKFKLYNDATSAWDLKNNSEKTTLTRDPFFEQSIGAEIIDNNSGPVIQTEI